MKQKVKDNIYFLLGQFFIWVIPIAMLVILAINSHTTKASVKLWVLVGIIIYLFAFFVVFKDKLAQTKQVQLTRDGYIHNWVYVLNWFTLMLPCACAFLILEKVKESVINDTHEIEFFVCIIIVCVTIGYLCLIKHSNLKSKKGVE